jgi:PAS domain S-box-containing protein
MKTIKNTSWCEDMAVKNSLFRSILLSIREGIITINRNWEITSFSPRAEELSGYKASDVIGKLCHHIIGNSNCYENCPGKTSMEAGTVIENIHSKLVCKNGRICPVIKKTLPLKNDAGDIIGSLIIIEDSSSFSVVTGKAKGFMGIIGKSAPMKRVFNLIQQVASTDVTVLIGGESGTGKEMVSKAIHSLSQRRNNVFQALNCAALPGELLESELFGHVKGAFTGANKDRIGNVEYANRGTLFLDEIVETPLGVQAKLLRFLQEREYQRLGESKIRKADVRIIAATNENLEEAVKKGKFREDLFYRINVIPLILPPLRDRKDDIPLLVSTFLTEISTNYKKPNMKFNRKAMERILKYSWPGNIRELRNFVEYCVVLSTSNEIAEKDLPDYLFNNSYREKSCDFYIDEKQKDGQQNPISTGSNLLPRQTEKEVIIEVLNRFSGNREKVANHLEIHRSTLYRKMRKYKIDYDL